MNCAGYRDNRTYSVLGSQPSAAAPGQTADRGADIVRRDRPYCRHLDRQPECMRSQPDRKAACHSLNCHAPFAGARTGRRSYPEGDPSQHSRREAPQVPEGEGISALNLPVIQRGPIVRAACIRRWAQVFHEPHIPIPYGHAVRGNQDQNALSPASTAMRCLSQLSSVGGRKPPGATP